MHLVPERVLDGLELYDWMKIKQRRQNDQQKAALINRNGS
jgi:hypothetical protein